MFEDLIVHTKILQCMYHYLKSNVPIGLMFPQNNIKTLNVNVHSLHVYSRNFLM